jgi:hypothetical protein
VNGLRSFEGAAQRVGHQCSVQEVMSAHSARNGMWDQNRTNTPPVISPWWMKLPDVATAHAPGRLQYTLVDELRYVGA